MSKDLSNISKDLDRVIDALSVSLIPESRLASYALHRIAIDLDEYIEKELK